MIKNQEEAIERVKELRDSYELHQSGWANRCLDIIEDYVKNSVYKNKITEETVLSIPKNVKMQEENYRSLIADVSGIARELGLGKDGTIDEIYAKIKEKDTELKKKDKIIDLMAEFLGEKDMGYYKKEEGGEFLGIMRRYSKEDWKQYFESKVEE